MGFIKKEFLIGVLVSVFAALSALFIYIEFFSIFNFQETLNAINEKDLIGKIVTLAAVPNLFVFFIYIKKKQDYRARGVLFTTILIAFTTFVIKLF